MATTIKIKDSHTIRANDTLVLYDIGIFFAINELIHGSDVENEVIFYEATGSNGQLISEGSLDVGYMIKFESNVTKLILRNKNTYELQIKVSYGDGNMDVISESLKLNIQDIKPIIDAINNAAQLNHESLGKIQKAVDDNANKLKLEMLKQQEHFICTATHLMESQGISWGEHHIKNHYIPMPAVNDAWLIDRVEINYSATQTVGTDNEIYVIFTSEFNSSLCCNNANFFQNLEDPDLAVANAMGDSTDPHQLQLTFPNNAMFIRKLGDNNLWQGAAPSNFKLISIAPKNKTFVDGNSCSHVINVGGIYMEPRHEHYIPITIKGLYQTTAPTDSNAQMTVTNMIIRHNEYQEKTRSYNRTSTTEGYLQNGWVPKKLVNQTAKQRRPVLINVSLFGRKVNPTLDDE